MPKVFDCFMVYNELDMVETRLEILKDVVDYHVIIEAGMTHSGNPKRSPFMDALASEPRFRRHRSRILYGYIAKLDGADSWARERFHRGYIAHLLHANAKPDDLIIVADADEIPNPDIIPHIQHGARLELDFYYYDVNHRVRQGWSIGALRWALEKDPNKIRTLQGHDDVPKIDNGGWHFSYFLSPQQVVAKLNAFMHHGDIAANVPRDPVWLGQEMTAGRDIIGRELPIDHVPLSDTLPRYILDNRDSYRLLGWIKD